MKTLRKSAAVFLLTALLASCNGVQNPGDPVVPTVPQGEVFVAPSTPVVSADTDLAQTAAVVQRASLQAQSLLSREALTPALYDALSSLGLLNLFGTANASPAALNPAVLGRRLLGNTAVRLNAQSTTTLDHPLPTGTLQIDAEGYAQQLSAQPTDGFVSIDARSGLTLKAEWKVGGAPTTSFDRTDFTDAQGNVQLSRSELPTSARLSVLRTSTARAIASATFTMTPGACLGLSGPDALALETWAGTEARQELKASARYAWNTQGVSLAVSSSLTTGKGEASAAVGLALSGSTANRCDQTTLSFTPTKLDASASVSVPNDSLNAELKMRDLGNLVFSADALKVQNPFAKVEGKLQVSADHNGQRFFSAFGPLADGADFDLNPGDGVEVKYVQGGKVVTTNLQALLTQNGR